MATFSSVRAQLRQGAALLAASSREPQRDAALLLGYVLDHDRAWLLTHPDAALAHEQQAHYEALLARRMQHEPMQYILGEQEFFGLRFKLTPAVLIPRPETEHLVEAVLARLPKDKRVRIADVGTGSGAIAVALAAALPLAEIDALDISDDALAIAEENARTHDVGGRVRLRRSDLLKAVRGEQFDAVVSNPPYIATTEVLERQVAEWEPSLALFAGEDGLAVYRRLLPAALEVLKPGGLLALELGAGQEPALRALFAQAEQYEELVFVPDLQGIARVALAVRPKA